MRLFRKCSQVTSAHVSGALYRWLFAQRVVDGLTFDRDSAVMTRYGEQQGIWHAVTPLKPGRLSHHPGTFVSDTRLVANCWPRSGNSHTTNNACVFLDSTFDKQGSRRVALLRTDSGFCDQAFSQEYGQKRWISSSSCASINGLESGRPAQRRQGNPARPEDPGLSILRRSWLHHDVRPQAYPKAAVVMRQRQWFEGIWDHSKAFSQPVRFMPLFFMA